MSKKISIKDATELTALLCRSEAPNGFRYATGKPAHAIARDARQLCAISKAVSAADEYLCDHPDNGQRAAADAGVKKARAILNQYGVQTEYNSDPRGVPFELTFPSGGTWRI